jgi:hypothetical protein
MRRAALLPILVALAGCPTGDEPKARTPEDFGVPMDSESGTKLVQAAPIEDHSKDPPNIARSKGHRGGLIVLWPRVVPASAAAANHEVVAKVQERLVLLAKRVAGARHIDMRPEPETTCPPDGCDASSISALVYAGDGACALVALIGGPKKAPVNVMQWVGREDIASPTAGFGDAPESLVKVKQFVGCDELLKGHDNEDSALARAIVVALPGH